MTNAELAALVKGSTEELAKWLTQLEMDLRAMAASDPKAARAAMTCGGAAKAAHLMSSRTSSFFNQSIIESTGANFHFATATPFNFIGAVANEAITHTVIGQDWVTAGSTIIPINIERPRSSDINAYNFNIYVDNIVPGVGFDLTMTTPSTGGVIGPDVYSCFWFSFG